MPSNTTDDGIDAEEVLEDTIPTFQQVQMDVLEFWCQTALKECDSRALYSQRCQGFYETIDKVGESVADYGRIHNRLQLAMLCADLTERDVTPADEEENEDSDRGRRGRCRCCSFSTAGRKVGGIS